MFKYVFIIFIFFIISFTFKPKSEVYQFPILENFPKMPQNTNNIVTIEGANLGRYLFYDNILSKNNSLSCSSCHIQKFAFSDSLNQFSKGINGVLTNRNTLPLFNLAWYPKLFWDGKAETIEDQIFHPVKNPNEMGLTWKEAAEKISNNKFYAKQFKIVFGNRVIDSVLITNAIAQFLRTLISNNSKFDRVLIGKDYFTPDEYKGFELVNDMTKGDCLHCHTTDNNALGTNGKFSNNGLDNIQNPILFLDKGFGAITNKLSDYGKFKTPSLRNLSFTAPYMHDGRFKTLEEVLDFYSEGVQNSINLDDKMGLIHERVKLSKEEKKQILAFLKTLNDSSFVKNSKYCNPF